MKQTLSLSFIYFLTVLAFPLIGQIPQSISKNNTSLKRNCYTNQIEERLQRKYPDRPDRATFEEQLQKVIQQKKLMRTSLSATDQIYRIPTIIHVVHNGENVGNGSNISQAQVYSQFDVLNEDFRRMGNGFNSHPDGADIFVEFYPVTVDPNGNSLAEPGINRIDGQRSFWEENPIEDQLKPATTWNPDRYFNFWVVSFGGDMDDVLGYAQFPSLSGLDGLFDNEGPASTDGVVVDHRFFGTTGTATSPYDLGRTATHEVGHWLGLIHIWGDGGCEVDDYCADTPNAGEPNGGCSSNDSCPGDGPDMIENYMDYTYDACMNIFTQDQKMRMRTVLENSPRRNSLIGPVCNEATEVNSGINNTSAPAWLSYTATADGIVTVSSVGQTTINTDLALYAGCNSKAINTSDDVLGTKQSELSTLVSNGDVVKIYWSNRHNDQSFNYNITQQAAITGAVCELAVPAQTGQNNLTATDLNSYWYSYNMSTELARLTINTGAYFKRIYSGQCSELQKISEGTGAIDLLDLAVGQTVFVEIEPQGGDFAWDLTVTAFSEGDVCETAVPAQSGANATPYTPYWFTYTMPQNGELIISSTNQGTVKTFGQLHNGCDGNVVINNNPIGEQSELRVPAVEGALIHILWDSVYSSQGFEWELSVESFEDGSNCHAAVQAQEGTNTTPQAPYWFEFTMPKDGNLNVSSVNQTEEDTYLYLLDACEGAVLEEIDDTGESAQSEGTLYSLTQGQTVKILWEDAFSQAGFNWSLQVLDPVPGDDCSNPVVAAIGENTIPSGYSTELFWYQFTVPNSNKKYSMLSDETDAYAFMVTGCEDPETLSSGSTFTINTNLNQEQEIFLVWENIPPVGFTWTLTEEDWSAGDDCSDPITASPGENITNYAPAWYTFTMPKPGDLLITNKDQTESDTFLKIYEACNGQPLTENDDISFDKGVYQSEVLLFDLEANQELLIYWAPEWSSVGFPWTLSPQNLINEVPDIPNQSFEIAYSDLQEGFEIGVINANDPDGDNITFTIIDGDAAGIFELDSISGTLSLVEPNAYDGNDLTLTVEVNDGYDQVQAEITINGFILGSELKSEISIYPVPTSDFLYLDLHGLSLQKGTILDLSGQEMMHFTHERIAVNHLADGIYFILLQLKKGAVMKKKIVIQR